MLVARTTSLWSTMHVFGGKGRRNASNSVWSRLTGTSTAATPTILPGLGKRQCLVDDAAMQSDTARERPHPPQHPSSARQTHLHPYTECSQRPLVCNNHRLQLHLQPHIRRRMLPQHAARSCICPIPPSAWPLHWEPSAFKAASSQDMRLGAMGISRRRPPIPPFHQ